MEKITVLLIKDSEETLLNKIMDIISEQQGIEQMILPDVKTNLYFSGLEIRLKEQAVYQSDKLIPMTHREFEVLSYLANHPHWVFSAKQIYEAVWKEEGENCGTAVASVIGQIRRKLTPETPKGGYIRTVIGSGYKFVPL